MAGLAQAKASLAQSRASLAETQAQLGAAGDANAQFRASEARGPAGRAQPGVHKGAGAGGRLRHQSQPQAREPGCRKPAVLALVDVNSYWIDGFFRENTIAGIRAGDRAVVTLMTYPDTPIEGRVDSIGWGIAQQDGSTGFELLPTISPTFEWIRLAQRVPVRIHLIDVPKDIRLRVGTTCSVLVMRAVMQ